MLRFESVFWASQNKKGVAEKLKVLGFNVEPSAREPHALSVDFGPESLELSSPDEKLVTLHTDSGLPEGIWGLGLESDDLAMDYKRLLAQHKNLEKLRRAKDTEKEEPLWFGFNVPPDATPGLRAWVFMNSPFLVNQQALQILPHVHPNTCFGVESVALLVNNPEAFMSKWSEVTEKKAAGLHWNEMGKTTGCRIQAGNKFLDALQLSPKLPLSAATGGREGVAMLTLKVTDLEAAKHNCQSAGAKVSSCTSRDGFIVDSSFTGGPALRFVRSFWVRYLPPNNKNFPFNRREDQFRPLGGSYTSTLESGFEDNWKY